MSKNEKLYNRLIGRPRDFSYAEAKRLLESYGFVENNKGKTSGSRVAFIRQSDNRTFFLHKPHPQGDLKLYVVDQLINFLDEIGCGGDNDGE